MAGLMISPLAKGLFHRAIMHSGGMKSQSVALTDQVANRTIQNALVMKGRAKDTEDAKAVLRKMNNKEIEELMRGLTTVELLTAHAGGPGKASVALANHIEDGYVIPGNLLCTVESGRYQKVPLILGSVESEAGSINTLLPSLKEGMPNFIKLLDVVQGKMKLEEVLPTEADKKIWKTTRYHSSRMWKAAFVDELARRVKNHQEAVYAYRFNWGNEDVRPGPKGFIYGAAHSQDIPFWHANATVEPFPGARYYMYEDTAVNRPGRKSLNDAMVSYVAQFARTGNPNGNTPGLPIWQPWSNEASGPKVILLDANLNESKLKMDNEEVSMASARKALDNEDETTQGWARLIIKTMQGYADYMKGDYIYNKCD